MKYENNEFFVQKFTILNLRGIENFEIPLNTKIRTHLIITGKNGSGKTSFLNELNSLLQNLYENKFLSFDDIQREYEKASSQYNDFKKESEDLQLELEAAKKILADLEFTDPINRATNQPRMQEKIQTCLIKLDTAKSFLNIASSSLNNSKKRMDDFSKITISLSQEDKLESYVNNDKFIMVFFKARRTYAPEIPKGSHKIDLSNKVSTNGEQLSHNFIQYIVNLRMEKLDAKDSGELLEVKKIDEWFDRFVNSLKRLFNQENLVLKYDRKNFNFNIEYDNKSFSFAELSDGYSSVLSIVTELILRMESINISNYDLQGIVLIDEIETHLHVELQKKILPFLVDFFPKIQFIVTTHSPFVISSLANSIICDLENKTVVQDLSAYSYESLVDSYFDTDKYSNSVKEKLSQYNEFVSKDKSLLTEDEKIELLQLHDFFENIPSYQNEEIKFEINKIQKLYIKNLVNRE